MTDRDLYADARVLADRLASRGKHAAARALVDAVEGGATSSEILFGLRAELDRVLEDPSAASDRDAVTELRGAVQAALD